MKKVERINTIMRYINNRSHFTISEIIREFNISRSTAIRDIRDIEAMGMPLVAEVGRTGGYFVMHNSILPVVRFTDNEVKALFIAFMATRNQQLPYLKSRQSLAEKLLGLISETQQDDLVLLNQLLLFEGTNPHNPDLLELSDLPHPMLEKLIQILLLDRHLLITVKEEEIKSYPIYLLHLYQEKSHWIIEGFDLKEEKKLMFPVDDLINIEPYMTKKKLHKKKILEKLSKKDEAINLVLELGPKAIAQYKKYHPFKVTISYTNPYQSTAILKTFIDINNPDELSEIINWLLFLGKDITIREIPDEVLKDLQERLCLYSP
ncbi:MULTISPECIES: helix-turn-helix transcriptional regulator [Bacillus]|uniref:helix-turn-helix transcriptional regulator n=1 Tax=Bacillus TaxID=1386 RepID=UPI00032FEAD7|nr:HTH domain-containing protein [Bacillus wiedmannii]EOP11671.1 DeoR family transcriptional regulator [Bacillus cereus BAG2O-3]EOQ10184.1 DeoR family transcriptional regulator [Bacillus cereus B5-2]EOQ29123.1 DeoR family transcriptional regulator [Bacillus cereus BAG3O-1]PEW34011.1 HTH domain-containing protein [Bacillus cereus]PFW78558.1 HTH domain-containing protein [Bacillus sp. AFS075960]RFB46494.1 HTH domain-containing protein [Bacillus sp. dmp10]RFB69181.1 HTH domain-containing protei